MILLCCLIPLAGTVLGSAFVFLFRNEMPERIRKTFMGFASGVMVAASFWSLLLPALEMSEASGRLAVVPSAVGFLAGMGFLYLIDIITPHLHFGSDHPEGPRTKLSRSTMLALAVTIHNFPEGMAVGVLLAAVIDGSADVSMAGAMAVAVGIAVQNIPEGAIVSMPMRAEGSRRRKAFAYGCMSGVVEPVGALIVVAMASVLTPLLPYMLAFAAGAMLYVVVEELIPESSIGEHSNLGTIGFAVGFVLMMIFDVMFG